MFKRNDLESLRLRAQQQAKAKEIEAKKSADQEITNIELAKKAAQKDLAIWSNAIKRAMKGKYTHLEAMIEPSWSKSFIYVHERGMFGGFKLSQVKLPGLNSVKTFHEEAYEAYSGTLRTLLGVPFYASYHPSKSKGRESIGYTEDSDGDRSDHYSSSDDYEYTHATIWVSW
jgi:hypothetical protein